MLTRFMKRNIFPILNSWGRAQVKGKYLFAVCRSITALAPKRCLSSGKLCCDSRGIGWIRTFWLRKGAFTGDQNRGSIGLIRLCSSWPLYFWMKSGWPMPMAFNSQLLRRLQERVVHTLRFYHWWCIRLISSLFSATNRTLKRKKSKTGVRQDYILFRHFRAF